MRRHTAWAVLVVALALPTGAEAGRSLHGTGASTGTHSSVRHGHHGRQHGRQLASLRSTSTASSLRDARLGHSKRELERQTRFSHLVLASYAAHGWRRWMIAPHRSTCLALTSLRTEERCRHARSELRAHRWLYRLANERLQPLLWVYTNDWESAVRIVGRYYGSSVKNWLWNCSGSEGGHGKFYWYGHGSAPAPGSSGKPGGWMQYFETTWNSDASWAFADAAARGLRVDPRAHSYWNALGQAVAAGAYYNAHGNPYGKWTGANC